MSTPHVLILGGHGKIAMLLTPLLLKRSWTVTSVVRNPDHESDITATSKNLPGKLDVLVSSIEDVKAVGDAAEVINSVKPDYVVWSAGAGGKGGAARTFAVDRDACKHYINAASKAPSVKKFMLVSYIGSRRSRPSWWNDDDWKASQEGNNALANYFQAKVEADEYLLAKAKAVRDEGKDFADICLRPGTLADDEGGNGVTLGHTTPRGDVSRADVAGVAAALLDTDYRGWVDLLSGHEDIEKAVEKVVSSKVDCVAGEDLDRIYSSAKNI